MNWKDIAYEIACASMPAGAWVFSNRMIAGCIAAALSPNAARAITSWSGV